ncbi:hypothetical protein EV651_11240 [Kribbella sp. VKM Ac-2571]|nr:hypothetical protein EV651_11240 [Kribbella sp. VKM Ac-2571]
MPARLRRAPRRAGRSRSARPGRSRPSAPSRAGRRAGGVHGNAAQFEAQGSVVARILGDATPERIHNLDRRTPLAQRLQDPVVAGPATAAPPTRAGPRGCENGPAASDGCTRRRWDRAKAGPPYAHAGEVVHGALEQLFSAPRRSSLLPYDSATRLLPASTATRAWWLRSWPLQRGRPPQPAAPPWKASRVAAACPSPPPAAMLVVKRPWYSPARASGVSAKLKHRDAARTSTSPTTRRRST